MSELLSRESETFDNPEDVREYLDDIRRFIIEANLDDIRSIEVAERCCNCLKRINHYVISFENESVAIKGWDKKCSFDKRKKHIEYKYTNTTLDDVSLKIESEHDNFHLSLNMYDLLNSKISLSNYYDDTDYEVHGTHFYRDRKIKFTIKHYEDKTIIASQNFIDFKGLDPMYNHLLIINYK